MSTCECAIFYAVYANPKDYPGKHVVRRWHVSDRPRPEVEPVAVVETLDEARAAIPEGHICLSRSEYDDPVLVETWA